MPGAYYNEIDPYAADWLRNLIAAGHIAPGDVDERSIEDVHPDDLRSYTQCHFFAGIGVWSYALRRAGWPDDRPVWTGSCPCQPFSAAGKGTAFDDERHLWPAWHWLIQECRPPVVFGEQVASKDAEPWLDLVSTDLEALAFAIAACAFPSASVGAPHIRDRTYFMAHAAGPGSQGRQLGGQRPVAQQPSLERGSRPGGLADAESPRPPHGGAGAVLPIASKSGGISTGRLADAHIIAGGQRRAIDRGRHPRGDARPRARSGGDGVPFELGHTHGERAGRDGGSVCGQVDRQDRQLGAHDVDAPGCAGGMAQPNCDGCFPGSFATETAGHRHPAGAARGDDRHHPAGPVNGFWRAADWLLCRDGKWRPVEPGTFPLAHGAPARVGRLRAYGNAINAQQAQIFIEESMKCL
ncbi:C-5 cytosine-specific DNA methylase [compost metagenome]